LKNNSCLKYRVMLQTTVTEVQSHAADNSYWSTEAYCRQQLLRMQVKHNTYHWGIQWNSMVMQVRKETFQRKGVHM
jgi:hypothetical protein